MIEPQDLEQIKRMIDEAIVDATDRIVTQAVIAAYRGLPAACTEVLKQKIVFAKVKDTLFKDNPEFKDNIDIVMSVLSDIEKSSLGKLSYSQMVSDAVPVIREKIKLLDGLNMKERKDKPNPMPFMGEL